MLHGPFWQGRAPYDPGAITSPTLIGRGERDALTPLALSQDLFGRLTGARSRSLVELPRLSHFLLIEHGRQALYNAIRHFLGKP